MTGLIIAVVVLFLLVIGLGILVWACIDYVGQVSDEIKDKLSDYSKVANTLHDENSSRINDPNDHIKSLESDFDQLKDRNNNSYTVSKKYWDSMASSHSILIANGETDHESK